MENILEQYETVAVTDVKTWFNVPKVVCPMHKKNFSLEDGRDLAGEDLKIATYPVKIENGNVYIGFSD